MSPDDELPAPIHNPGAGAGDVSVRQAEFEVLNVIAGTRGRDEPDSPFLAESLPRAGWDPDSKPALRNIERVVLVHRLREVMALVGFTRFEPASTDEKGELDLDGIAPAALSPEPEWFPAIETTARASSLWSRPRRLEIGAIRPESGRRAPGADP